MQLSNTISKRTLVIFTIMALSAFGYLFSVMFADAHADPGPCTANGVGLSLTVFRSDGTTPVGGGSIAPGETVKYEATLSHLGGTNCNYEGGTLSITTPDAVAHVVASPATPVVPLVSTSSPFVSSQVSYVANSADVGGDGDLDSSADYTGGSSHTGTSHDSASAHVDVAKQFQKLNPGIRTEVHDPAHADITNATTTQGTAVHDKVILSATSTGPTPGGTADFTLYSGLTCNGTVLSTENNVAVSGGSAESTATTTASGSYSYLAHYDGDANYNEATATCEPFNVFSQNQPTLNTTPDPSSGNVGATLNDSATLSGANSPTGSITFKLFPPSDASCQGVASYTQVVPLTGNSASTSPGFVSNAPGTWRWTADYPGDVNNTEAHSTCQAEPVVISQPAGQWCSHGYWKQSHHFDSWVGYTPGQQFSSVFDDAFPGMTLLQVLQQGGGGLKALGRDTVGELLNTSAGLTTGFTTAQIIANFNAVFPGSKSDYEALHATFVAPHNCPLN